MTPREFTQQDAIRQRDVLMKMLSQIGEALGRQHWSGGPGGFSAGDVIKRLMPPEAPGMSQPAEVEAALYQWKNALRERARGVLAPNEMADLLATVTALVDAAVARERERCAEIAAASRKLLAELSTVQLDAVQEGAGVTNRRVLELRRDELVAAIREAPRP